ncbi:hypothetical protein [Plantactinospora sp. CA-290183]
MIAVIREWFGRVVGASHGELPDHADLAGARRGAARRSAAQRGGLGGRGQ